MGKLLAEHNFGPETPILGVLASHEVVVDRTPSHNHLLDDLSPETVSQILDAALFEIDAAGRDYLVADVDSQGVVLQQHCVKTSNTDEIVFAHRHDRPGPTRFVLDREPEATDCFSVILKRSQSLPGVMALITAVPGVMHAPEPWDRNLADEAAIAASKAFWQDHALIWTPSSVDFSRPFWPDQGSLEQSAPQNAAQTH